MDRSKHPDPFAELGPGGITAAASRNDLAWWQKGAFYQIAPVSFLDTDGDGRGDLKGVIDRIEYLEWLGVGAIWLCPIYPSPFRDFGYDISDFCNIDPTYGTLAEFDLLVAELHARDLKLLLDFVPNHTSDTHPWFGESRSSRRNPKRDWLVLRDPAPAGRASEQLAQPLRRHRVGVGRRHRPVLLSCVPARTAGSELAESRRARRH